MVLRDFNASGYKILLNPFFWVVLLSTMYLIVPAFFVDAIDHYFNWGLTGSDVLLSQLLVFIYFVSILIFYNFFPSHNLISNEQDVQYPVSYAIKSIWLLVFIYALFVLFKSIQSGFLENAFIYDFSQEDPYKLKNIAYLLIPISIYMYSSSRSYFAFMPNLLVMALDLMNGSRTIALIVLIPIVISFCVHKKKIYVLPMTLFVFGLLLLGVLRLGSAVEEIPWYIRAIGEFRETYITLPLYITNDSYVGLGRIDNLIAGFLQGIFQPIRSIVNSEYVFSGTYLASDINRGYGLGSNFLISSMYYGYHFIFITSLVFFAFLTFCYHFILNAKFNEKLIFISLLVIFTRLIIREGFYTSLGMFCFICLFYWLPFYLISKVKFKFSRAN